MNNTAATTTLSHRVGRPTITATDTYLTHCDGCGWTGAERTSEFAADIEGMMHEFDGNQAQS